MYLYNFFTEVVPEGDIEKLNKLKACFEELKPECVLIEMACRTNYKGENEYSLIGQIYGDDTSAGNTLLSTFINIKYFWFDVNRPTINNICDCWVK